MFPFINSGSLDVGSAVRVNGKRFEVTRAGFSVSLRGARGADYTMVQNVNSGWWYLIAPNGRDALVTSFDIG